MKVKQKAQTERENINFTTSLSQGIPCLIPQDKPPVKSRGDERILKKKKKDLVVLSFSATGRLGVRTCSSRAALCFC